MHTVSVAAQEEDIAAEEDVAAEVRCVRVVAGASTPVGLRADSEVEKVFKVLSPVEELMLVRK